MRDRIRFVWNRISERLWVRPLVVAVLSIAGTFLAKTADDTGVGRFVPDISPDSIEGLLKIISASMLVIATFAVASMVSAYASASSTATPRSFTLIIADDGSQNALSTFIGAFIYSIVSLIAMQNGYFDKAGRFALFALTLLVFAVVIMTFVRWVDSIARLGRLGATIDKVERAAAAALERRRLAPTLRGVQARPRLPHAQVIYGSCIGYVQRIDIPALQAYAEKADLRIDLASLPGIFAAPGRALAYVSARPGVADAIDESQIAKAFTIGDDRIFDEDPRFGLIVLSEIAGRALSPAVNDPGTAIDIIGTLVRLFARWSKPLNEKETVAPQFDRVGVPTLSLQDMFDDAFTAIARDGAGSVEVAARLQKALASLAFVGNSEMRHLAMRHSRLALARSEHAMSLPEDVEVVRSLAAFARST